MLGLVEVPRESLSVYQTESPALVEVTRGVEVRPMEITDFNRLAEIHREQWPMLKGEFGCFDDKQIEHELQDQLLNRHNAYYEGQLVATHPAYGLLGGIHVFRTDTSDDLYHEIGKWYPTFGNGHWATNVRNGNTHVCPMISVLSKFTGDGKEVKIKAAKYLVYSALMFSHQLYERGELERYGVDTRPAGLLKFVKSRLDGKLKQFVDIDPEKGKVIGLDSDYFLKEIAPAYFKEGIYNPNPKERIYDPVQMHASLLAVPKRFIIGAREHDLDTLGMTLIMDYPPDVEYKLVWKD